jgi:hypothetical protein
MSVISIFQMGARLGREHFMVAPYQLIDFCNSHGTCHANPATTMPAPATGACCHPTKLPAPQPMPHEPQLNG